MNFKTNPKPNLVRCHVGIVIHIVEKTAREEQAKNILSLKSGEK